MSPSSPTLPLVPRVLVVEDEAMLRQSVVAGLMRLGGIEVVGTDSVAGALQEIQQRAPALIISDIDLPDRSGIELLGELGARGLKPHLVFVSAYVKAYRAQIPPNAGVEVLEKPVSMEQLRGLVTARLAHPHGDGSPFGVSDYLQLASLGHHSVRIEVVSESNTGYVVVVAGEAWTAEDAGGTGPAAFRRLALAPKASVRCQTLQGDPGLHTLSGSAEALLLECARLADEGRAGFSELELDEAVAAAGGAAARGKPAVPEAAGPEPTSFEEWFDRGVEASLRKRHAEALTAFRKAAEHKPADPKTQANITRLEQLLTGLKQA
jgi:CheY-like chemotaxis protein